MESGMPRIPPCPQIRRLNQKDTCQQRCAVVPLMLQDNFCLLSFGFEDQRRSLVKVMVKLKGYCLVNSSETSEPTEFFIWKSSEIETDGECSHAARTMDELNSHLDI